MNLKISGQKALSFVLVLSLALGLWGSNSINVKADSIEYTITFNPNGSSQVIQTANTVEGKLVSVPAIAREGFSFEGWYESNTPTITAVAINKSTVFTKNTTVYAIWQADYAKIVTTDGSKEVTIGYAPSSGVKLIKADGTALSPAEILAYDKSYPIFKDLNKNGVLDPYEDWRMTYKQRALNLSSQMAAATDNVSQIAGLMLYSAHYGVTSAQPTDAQKTYLSVDNLRHVLVTTSSSPEMNAKWNNNVQAFTESTKFGIPSNNSSDPRHGASTTSGVEYYVENSGVSAWPTSLGLAATFNVDTMKQFGKIASIEYRALGISTALSPQIDIATDPRWSRFNGTFGEDPKLASAMAKAYVDGFQTTYIGGISNTPVTGGWGNQSVNAMIKHWPGGGAGEGGRDAHYDYGKYAVYPGDNFEAHMIPFVDGSLSLSDGTGMATAVMPYYTISYMQTPGSEPNNSNLPGAKLNMANAYNDYMINGVLRDAYEFEGVVCTDWNVVGPKTAIGGGFDADIPGMIWGADDHYGITGFTMDDMAQRARMLLDAGVDQFGGLNTTAPIVTAYNNATDEDKAKLLAQLQVSAYRLLMNIFRAGLFEDAYLIPAESKATVGKDDFMVAGYKAQLESMVLLKDQNSILPLAGSKKVYAPGADANTVNLLKLYFGNSNVTTDAASASAADYAIVFMNSVSAGGGSRNTTTHVNGYTPINLDFKSYTATNARTTSIAGIPVRETAGDAASAAIGMENRSYKGLTTNISAATATINTNIAAAKASGKPVILSINMSNPMVMGEIEPYADVMLVNFGSQKSAVLDMLTGSTRYGKQGGSPTVIYPTGMMPMQLPKDMNEVEQQYEDVPRDMVSYTDSQANVYDFGFGLTWKGGLKKIDATVNPGFTPFVTDNTIAMKLPINMGTKASSPYLIANRVKVKFDYGYKEAATDKENAKVTKVINKGSTVNPAEIPARDDHTFLGWYNGATKFNFANKISNDLVLIAKWDEEDDPVLNTSILNGPDKINSGQEFVVTYGMRAVSLDTLAQDVTVIYDADKLEFVSVKSARDGIDIVGTEETPGQVRLIAAKIGGAVDPNGDQLTLRFKAKETDQGTTAKIAVAAVVANGAGVESDLNQAAHNVQIDIVDKAALNALISEAQSKHDAAEEGTKIGQYPAGTKATLQSAINRAKAVASSASATQAQLEQAESELNAAMRAFLESIIKPQSGDVNEDNRITIGDLAIVAAAYGKSSSDPDWNQYKRADINDDGKVDIEDLVNVARMILGL